MTKPTAPRQQFAVYRNRAFVGFIQGRTLREAVKLAKARYGRVEVIGTYVSPVADRFHGPDAHRTEGRAPCNQSEAAQVKIEAIRQAEIARWKAENA